jgi:hypothetical protein
LCNHTDNMRQINAVKTIDVPKGGASLSRPTAAAAAAAAGLGCLPLLLSGSPATMQCMLLRRMSGPALRCGVHGVLRSTLASPPLLPRCARPVPVRFADARLSLCCCCLLLAFAFCSPVTVVIKNRKVTVTGPRGTLTRDLSHLRVDLRVEAKGEVRRLGSFTAHAAAAAAAACMPPSRRWCCCVRSPLVLAQCMRWNRRRASAGPAPCTSAGVCAPYRSTPFRAAADVPPPLRCGCCMCVPALFRARL